MDGEGEEKYQRENITGTTGFVM